MNRPGFARVWALAAPVLALVAVRARALADLVAAKRVPAVARAQALADLMAAMLVLAVRVPVAPAQAPVAWATVPADRATAMAPAMVMEAAREEREVASTDNLDLGSDMT